MNRRKFTKVTSASMILPLIHVDTKATYNQNDLSKLIEALIKQNDDRIPSLLSRQETHKTHKWYGGIKNEFEIFSAGHAAGFIQSLTCSYISPYSKYHSSSELMSAMMLSSKYLLKAQYDDGNIDLPSTNFHSPPDTAFVVEPLCIAYTLLDADKSEDLKLLKKNLKNFLINAGEALMIGGIHTANHRWVVCMALARLNTLFPHEQYLTRIDQWLAEKIDIDPDGQYAERSTLIYTPLVNRCLITIARLADKPELFDPVRKNLDMTLYYIHPNGEITTESSDRQDRNQKGTMENYWYAYQYISILDKNGTFAIMALNIQNLGPDKLGFWLSYIMEDPFLENPLPPSAPVPDNYLKEFYHSDLIRIRRGNVDATILGNNPNFLTFFKGNAALESIRLASAFFGKGQFKGQTFERSGNAFIMRQKLIGPYYQPLTEKDIPDDGNGWQVSRMKRDQSEVQEHETKVIIEENEGQVEISVHITGTDNVPYTIELAFRKGGKLEHVTEVEGIPNAFLASAGKMIKYTYQDDTITFGPGVKEHSWTQLRGALPKLDADCVYFTGFTPLEITFSLE